jgi:hypothetical protein
MEPIERRLGLIDYIANDVGDKSLPRVHAYKDMLLRLSGTLTIGTAAATALKGYTPLSLLKKIRLVVNGEDGIKSYDGKLDFIQNGLDAGVDGERVAPGLTVAAHPFSGTLKVHFELPAYPEYWKQITRLNSALLTDLTLQILFGAGSDLVTPDTTTTLVISACKVEIFGLEYPDVEAQRVYSIFKETTKRLSVIAANDELAIPITTKNQILSILLLSVNNSLDSDLLVTKVSAVVDGTSFKKVKDWKAMKEDTKQFYRIAPPTGVACLIFDDEMNMANALRLAGTGSFELVFNVIAPTGVAYIDILIREVVAFAG